MMVVCMLNSTRKLKSEDFRKCTVINNQWQPRDFYEDTLGGCEGVQAEPDEIKKSVNPSALADDQRITRSSKAQMTKIQGEEKSKGRLKRAYGRPVYPDPKKRHSLPIRSDMHGTHLF